MCPRTMRTSLSDERLRPAAVARVAPRRRGAARRVGRRLRVTAGRASRELRPTAAHEHCGQSPIQPRGRVMVAGLKHTKPAQREDKDGPSLKRPAALQARFRRCLRMRL